MSAANRARWPWLAEIVDELRATFGPAVKVAQIREAGMTVAGGPAPLPGYYLPTPATLARWQAFVASFEALYGPVGKQPAKFATYCETHYTRHCEDGRG